MLELDTKFKPPTHVARETRVLKRRLAFLRSGLLLAESDGTQEGADRVHAYRLLAHSEVQNFLERIAERVLSISEDSFGNHGYFTHAAHHLIVFDSILKLGSKVNASQAYYPYFSRSSVQGAHDSRFTLAVRAHRKKIKENSGLKQSNLRSILGPLGFRDEWFAPGFLDQMDAFGSSRGDVAHGSGVVVGTTQFPTWSTEVSTIAALLPGLERIDTYTTRLLMPS